MTSIFLHNNYINNNVIIIILTEVKARIITIWNGYDSTMHLYICYARSNSWWSFIKYALVNICTYVGIYRRLSIALRGLYLNYSNLLMTSCNSFHCSKEMLIFKFTKFAWNFFLRYDIRFATKISELKEAERKNVKINL